MLPVVDFVCALSVINTQHKSKGFEDPPNFATKC